MREHIESAAPAPRLNGQLEQLENALADAKRHRAMLQGKFANNKTALTNQERIIKQYERQIRDIKGDWLNGT